MLKEWVNPTPDPTGNLIRAHRCSPRRYAQSGRDLKRMLLNVEPGFNWVMRKNSNNNSWFELKLSGSYYHNFNKLYANESRDSLTLNAALRIRIISDIWVPLEIKYDPKWVMYLAF